MHIDLTFIEENILGAGHTAATLREQLDTSTDLELGLLVVPFAWDAEGDDLPDDEADELREAWGAAWRREAEELLAKELVK